MQLKETYEALNKFGKYLVQQSRSNLTRGNKNVSKALYNDLDYNIEVGKESFLFSFKMPEYGIYQDSGVSGTDLTVDDKQPGKLIREEAHQLRVSAQLEFDGTTHTVKGEDAENAIWTLVSQLDLPEKINEAEIVIRVQVSSKEKE